jgi:hypothetical protein
MADSGLCRLAGGTPCLPPLGAITSNSRSPFGPPPGQGEAGCNRMAAPRAATTRAASASWAWMSQRVPSTRERARPGEKGGMPLPAGD